MTTMMLDGMSTCIHIYNLYVLVFHWVGICGQVDYVVDLETLAPQRYGFESSQGLRILSY